MVVYSSYDKCCWFDRKKVCIVFNKTLRYTNQSSKVFECSRERNEYFAAGEVCSRSEPPHHILSFGYQKTKWMYSIWFLSVFSVAVSGDLKIILGPKCIWHSDWLMVPVSHASDPVWYLSAQYLPSSTSNNTASHWKTHTYTSVSYTFVVLQKKKEWRVSTVLW